MDIQEILKQEDTSVVISELCSKRNIPIPSVSEIKKHLDIYSHDVMNPLVRKKKKVTVSTDDEYTGSKTGDIILQEVNRIPISFQDIIIDRAVSFIFGNNVTIECDPATDGEKAVFEAAKKISHDTKERSFNRKIARSLFSYTEVAEMWYPVQKKNAIYGFPSKYKLKCAIFSYENSDGLYPYFDRYMDMVAFSRKFTVKEDSSKSVTYFETYTAEYKYMWVQDGVSWKMMEGYPEKNMIGKIPVIFSSQSHTEYGKVQPLISRLEDLLSNFADTNDYFASPTFFVKGGITGFAKKGETGKIIEGDTDSDLSIISWDQAPESIKLEIETLIGLVYSLTQTPDISFESVKGLTSISGVALELLFMDAHLKVGKHQEVLDEHLDRRMNVKKAFIAAFNQKLEADCETIVIEQNIIPYIIKDPISEVKVLTEANGGNPVMSQKASFEKAGMTSDPDADYEQYLKEESSRSSFNLSSPTFP